MYIGAGIAGIGIPIWISGAMRKSDIEIAMAKYTSQLRIRPGVILDQGKGYAHVSL